MGHTLVVVHGNHVKTPWRRPRKMHLRERTKIVATDGFDVAPLLAIHRCGSGFHVTRCKGFDLDEARHIFVLSNKIDFAMMPRGAVILRNHHVPAAAKIKICVFFSTTASAEVFGCLFVPCNSVQKANGSLRDAGGKHLSSLDSRDVASL